MSLLLEKYRKLSIQLKASIWFLMCAFMQKGISVFTTPVYTRLLTPTEYGQYNVLLSWQSIIRCIVVLNLYGGMYAQGLVKHEGKERSKFASSMQGLAFVLVLGWGIIYIIFRQYWNKILSVKTFQMLLILITIWTASAFNFWAVEKRIELQYKKLVVITVIASISNPILGIALVKMWTDKVTARLLATAIIEVILYGGLFISQIIKGQVFFVKENWKYALTFCIPLIPHYLSQVVLNSSDRIMIQKLVDDSSAGIYSLAYSVSLVMTLFNNSLLQTIEPWLYQKLKENKVESIKKVMYPSLIFIAIVNVLLIGSVPEIIKFFAPESYYNAIWVVPPVTMSVYFMFLYSFFAFFEFYFEKPHYITIATVTGALTNIVLNYFFINIYGYYAAGYTTLICYIIYALMHYIFMRKVVKDNIGEIEIYNVRVIIMISIIFILSSFALMITYHYPLIRYISLLLFVILIIVKRKMLINAVRTITKIRSNL